METIQINLNSEIMKKDQAWQMCVGSGHATMALRKDWCEYTKRIHDELGIKYVRFHGIFDDDMLTIQTLSDFIPIPHANEVYEYSFRQVGKVYDNVLSTGMKPFVELSFMPSALASGKKTGLHYKNNITPPKDYNEWANYIKAFIKFLLERYGKEEVESWYFEVWNEPDLKVFYTANQEEYFKLYKHTALAVKECDDKLRVGGPSSSGSRWLDEFIAFIEKEKLPCDFISTHQYPGDGFGNEFKISDVFSKFPKIIKKASKEKIGIADTITELFYDSDNVKIIPKGIMKNVVTKARSQVGDYPLFYTEWNCMAIFGAPCHDEKYSAAYAMKTLLDMDGETDVFSIWCCNDLFEEILFLNQPFHGGYGLINNIGIPKPVFWALKLLANTYDKRLKLPVATNEPVEYAAFTDGERVQIFVYAFDTNPEADEEYKVKIELSKAAKKMNIQRISDGFCDPKGVWENLGKPMDPNPTEIEAMIEKSLPFLEEIIFDTIDDKSVVELTIHSNDIAAIFVE